MTKASLRRLSGLVPKGRSRLLIFVTAFMVLAVYAAIPAFAVHDTGRFQLDGDASSSTQPIGPPATDDWDKVCHQASPTDCPSGSNTTGATAVSWVSEPDRSKSIFTGGGSKDPQDISNWAWKDAGGLPDKDNLRHSFAARYSLPDDHNGLGPTECPSGTNPTCELLYFGSDRFDNSGDAQQGFWFFQNRITLGSTSSGGGFNFNGVHRNGDLLIISDFSNGGTVSTIKIYQWNDTVSGNLELLESSDAAKCSNALPLGDPFCGIVNPGTITMPWSFTDKSNTPSNGALNGEFYEGGVNLSLLPGGIANECFASVASETRSSTSVTATLKDFVLGNFGNCVATLSTTPSATSVAPGEAVHDTATVVGNQPTKTPSGDIEFALCSFPVGSTEVCDGTVNVGTSIGTGTLSGSGATATAVSTDVNTAANPLTPGHYCFFAHWDGDTNYTTPLDFDGAGECFDVVTVPTTTATRQFVYPQDKARITAPAGSGNLAGSVRFRLYDTLANCNADGGTAATGLLYEELGTAHPISGASPQFATTSNTTVAITSNTTVYWRVFYDSTNASQDDSESACTESTQVTYAGNEGTITVP